MAKHKHLTLDERYAIQRGIEQHKSFRKIAQELGRDTSTIAKEVKRHLEHRKTGAQGMYFNDCKHRRTCRPGHKCLLDACEKYVKHTCVKLTKAPYVCNCCESKLKCTLEKQIYSASKAHQEYKLSLRAMRGGLCITEEEIVSLDKVISPLLMKGQSLHHICVSNRDKIMFSERTLYNYIDMGLFTAKNVDMPRKVRFRPRKSSHDSFKVDKRCRIGRTLEDYNNYLNKNPDTAVVQMDSVMGKVGGKLLLTIHFVKTEFMLAFLRDRNTAASVTEIFNSLYEKLGFQRFTKLFPIILCDNGSEFSNPTAIEVDSDGVIRTKLFYCDPSSPYQKGAVENNHEFIRRIIPKSKSMDDLTQHKVNLMMSHINSYRRENLGDKSPTEVFKFFYGQDTLDILGIAEIPANDILLKPSLLR
ncbi:MAG: IS30 family transposase [Firmicutes bacterium]|nr:IS30 family transposase [Bacillota bacterium]